MTYRCSICNEEHSDLPHIGMERPDMYWMVPEEEREFRIRLTSDTCEIDGEDFFIRGVIEIPVHDSDEDFGFGVWVSQKKENYETYLANFDSAEIGPFFGWLCSNISFYSDRTLSLKTMAYFRGGSSRPSIVLEPNDHPLSTDQQNGITLERAWEIVHHYM